MIIAPINAIDSWEGYEYQGHIALYTALSDIEVLSKQEKAISNMDLQIEGEEDFSIRKDGKYVSLHQVKHGAVNLNDNDKFSFIIEILQNKAKYGYFHITTDKKIPNDFVEQSLVYIENLLIELDKQVLFKDEVGKGEEKSCIIIENIHCNTKKASIYNILNFVCGDNKSKKQVQSAIEKVKQELVFYKKKIVEEIEKFQNAHTYTEKDKRYLDVYKSRFESVRDIRMASCGVVFNILNILHPEWSMFVDEDYTEFVYNQVLIMLKERVTDFHIAKNKKGKCIITYDELIQVIQNNYHVMFDSVDYQFFKVLNSIKKLYEEYPHNPRTSCQATCCVECVSNSDCNLFEQINIINSKSDIEKEKIIHNLILETPEPGKSNNLPDDNLITRLLLNMLDEIKLLKVENNNVIQAIKSDGEFYRLSLDNSSEIYELQERISKELNKSADKSLIFECDVLITDHLNKKTFLYNGANVNVLEEEQLGEIRSISSDSIEKIKMDCNKPKVIRLVDREQAKGDLIDG